MSKDKTSYSEMPKKKLDESIASKRTELALLRRNITSMRETGNHKVRATRKEIARMLTAQAQMKEEK